jgi:hypothetical protein
VSNYSQHVTPVSHGSIRVHFLRREMTTFICKASHYMYICVCMCVCVCVCVCVCMYVCMYVCMSLWIPELVSVLYFLDEGWRTKGKLILWYFPWLFSLRISFEIHIGVIHSYEQNKVWCKFYTDVRMTIQFSHWASYPCFPIIGPSLDISIFI